MTVAEFNSAILNQGAQNFRPVFMSGLSVGGVPYYNVIWHHLPGADIVARAELNAAGYQAEHANRTRQGYTLVHLWTFNVGPTERFAAIWRRNVASTLGGGRSQSGRRDRLAAG